MAQVSIKIKNLDRMLKRLDKYGKSRIKLAASHLFKEGEGIMTVSKETFVPVDIGTLRDSGHVQLPKITGSQIVVTLGFGGPAAPYALFVHEDLSARHTVGSAKYLELPFRQAARGLSKRLAQALKRGPIR